MKSKGKRKTKENIVWTGTTEWVGWDTYELVLPVNRWLLIKWFFRGYGKLQWFRPSNAKRKGIYIKGKKKAL